MNQMIKRKNYKQIEGDLRTRIRNMEWRPGEKMDSFRELSQHYQCSVNTVAKALQNLEAAGFVEREPRRGILISEHVETQKKTGLAAAFVPQIDNPLWMSAIRGIEDYLHEYNYSMISGSHDLSSERLRQTLDNLDGLPIDGMILSPLNSSDQERAWFRNLIETQQAKNIKVVLLDRSIFDLNVPYVTTDNINASYKLTRMLLENGHRAVGFVGSRIYLSTVEERYMGFSQACIEAGLGKDSFFDFRIILSQEDFRAEYDTFGEQLLRHLEQHPVTALFAANDQIAKAILMTFARAGIRVPEDISLVSYDVDNLRREFSLKITGVRQNFYEMGKASAHILLNQIFVASPGEQVQQLGTVVPSEILKGDSIQRLIPQQQRSADL